MNETGERVLIFAGSCVVVFASVMVYLAVMHWLFVMP
jgi:hypothetical protein